MAKQLNSKAGQRSLFDEPEPEMQPSVPDRYQALMPGVAFVYSGVDVMFDDGRLVSLTDIWRAVGNVPNRSPKDWERLPDTVAFIASLSKNLNVGKSHLWKSRRGKHLGGTYAHWQIALAYGKYLSHDLHQFVNAAFREYCRENNDPGLKISRGFNGYRRMGKSETWIETRSMGIVEHKGRTDEMKSRGCQPIGATNPYIDSTVRMTKILTDKTPAQHRKSKALAKSAKTRDSMTEVELGMIRFADLIAKNKMRRKDAKGNTQCVTVCVEAATVVRQAVDKLG